MPARSAVNWVTALLVPGAGVSTVMTHSSLSRVRPALGPLTTRVREARQPASSSRFCSAIFAVTARIGHLSVLRPHVGSKVVHGRLGG